MKKRLIMMLMSIVLLIGGLNIFAEEITGVDRSGDFKIDVLTISFGGSVVYDLEKDLEMKNLEIPGQYNIGVNMKWSQKTPDQNDFEPGDYIIFKVFEAKNVGNAKLQFTEGKGQLWDDGKLLASYKLVTEKNGDNFIAYYIITFEDDIAGMDTIMGTLSGQTTVTSNEVGNTISFSRDDECFADVTTKESVIVGDKPIGITKPNVIEEQGKTGTSQNGYVTWRIPVTDMLHKQFPDYLNDYKNQNTNIVIEESFDAYQKFTDMKVTYPVYLFDPNNDYTDVKELIQMQGTPAFIHVGVSQGMTSLTQQLHDEGLSNAEIRNKIHSTPRSYALITEEDSNNLGKERQVLIVNFGAPGSTGLRYTDVNKSKLEEILTSLKSGYDNAVAVIASNSNVAEDEIIKDPNSQTQGTLATWKNMRDIYEASIEYYNVTDDNGKLIGPYIYGMILHPHTASNQEMVSADRISRVYNSIKIFYGEINTEYDSWVEISYKNQITAKYSTGDIVIFKEDSRFNNTIEELDKASNLENLGLLTDVKFVVKDNNGSVVKFNYNEETKKYVYSSTGEYDVITTSLDGYAVITGLANKSKYYFSEVDVEGYYSKQNQDIEVSVDYRIISFVLVSNHARGVRFTKVDSANNSIKLPNAVFELYKYDENINDTVKVEGFKIVEIGGVKYYDYDGTTETVLTTDEDGLIQVSNLDSGKYYFKEVEAPENYYLSDEKYTFELTDEISGDVVVNLGNVVNELIPEEPTSEYKTPDTGMLTNNTVFVAILLGGLALLVFVLKKKNISRN